jgi:autoinducer 2-degrading protein
VNRLLWTMRFETPTQERHFPQQEGVMYVVFVTIVVKADQVEAFAAASADNHRNTRLEPGNRRFDVIQLIEDPTRFALYEVYVDEQAFKAHQQTAHYLRWRLAADPMMAEKRVATRYQTRSPEPWDS